MPRFEQAFTRNLYKLYNPDWVKLLFVLFVLGGLAGCSLDGRYEAESPRGFSEEDPCWWKVGWKEKRPQYIIYCRVVVDSLPDTLKVVVPK